MYLWKVSVKLAEYCLDHLRRIVQTGTDNTSVAWDITNMGDGNVILWRKFRDSDEGKPGEETEEVLPEFLAECILASIPDNEPNVARAKIIYRRER